MGLPVFQKEYGKFKSFFGTWHLRSKHLDTILKKGLKCFWICCCFPSFFYPVVCPFCVILGLTGVSRGVRLYGNDGRQARPGLHCSAMVLALGLRVREACMYALHANPTVVQNDEHILAKPPTRVVALGRRGCPTQCVRLSFRIFVKDNGIGCMFVCINICSCPLIYFLSSICNTADLTLQVQWKCVPKYMLHMYFMCYHTGKTNLISFLFVLFSYSVFLYSSRW